MATFEDREGHAAPYELQGRRLQQWESVNGQGGPDTLLTYYHEADDDLHARQDSRASLQPPDIERMNPRDVAGKLVVAQW
jgi:hypothetical protein